MTFGDWLKQPFLWVGACVTGAFAVITGGANRLGSVRNTALSATLVGLVTGVGIGVHVPLPAPTVTLPATLKVATGEPVQIKATASSYNAGPVEWQAMAHNGTYELLPFGNTAVLHFHEAGTYTVHARQARGGKICCASTSVVVGDPTPPPPPPPPPSNPLTASLQKGYDLDNDTDKAISLAFLQQVYSGMVSLSKDWTDVKTNGDAFAKIKSIVEAPNVGLAPTKVANLRKAIGAELTSKFGTTSTTSIDLPSLSTELDNISKALEGVK